MDSILRGYHVNEPTWFYLSLLLIVAVYFRFGRIWSLRNLDLGLLLAIAPGLLLVREGGSRLAAAGYGWLLAISGLLLTRVLTDGLIARRPRLKQNMNAAGMTFLCAATFVMLTAKLLTDKPAPATVESVRKAQELIDGEPPLPVLPESAPGDSSAGAAERPESPSAGPATTLVTLPVTQLSKVVTRGHGDHPSASDFEVVAARLVAILSHLAVIVGLWLVGRHIFVDHDAGFAMATLYMLLPCTAFDVGQTQHVLPAACVVWAIRAYRRPFVSGTLLGLASGMMYFPILLLPLWTAFYGRRGGTRFLSAVLLTTGLVLATFWVLSGDRNAMFQNIGGYVEWTSLALPTSVQAGNTAEGFWNGREAYRIPAIVGFAVLLVGLTIWPARKSLVQVMTHSAAIVIGTQFWYPRQGGVYVLWYLPLLLLVIFRPNMANHFAPEFRPLGVLRLLRGRAPILTPEVTPKSAGGTTAL